MAVEKEDLQDLRKDYRKHQLTEEEAGGDPLALFGLWFEDALSADPIHANAFVLATADGDGRPSARVLLLKGFDPAGFVFYTNYDSRKGSELAANPFAAMVFWWEKLERQVRIEGRVDRVARSESLEYFQSRPRESRIGAHASRQSSVIPDRRMLEDRVRELNELYPGEDVPLPETWGGYRLVPDAMEFWQGRANRLHDRLRFTKDGDAWKRLRLSP